MSKFSEHNFLKKKRELEIVRFAVSVIKYCFISVYECRFGAQGGLALLLAKIITKIMDVVHIKLSIAATIQFEIHPRCQEAK
jgi:hypothetical protein